MFENRRYGDLDQSYANKRLFGKDGNFNQNYVYRDKVLGTISRKISCQIVFDTGRYLSKGELCKASTFPLDYDFGKMQPNYFIGMSVPPVITAQIATRIYEQWLSKL